MIWFGQLCTSLRWAGIKRPIGQLWPTGLSLPTPGLDAVKWPTKDRILWQSTLDDLASALLFFKEYRTLIWPLLKIFVIILTGLFYLFCTDCFVLFCFFSLMMAIIQHLFGPHIEFSLEQQVQHLRSTRSFYLFNLSWNNEGTGLTWSWNCLSVSCSVTFESLNANA